MVEGVEHVSNLITRYTILKSIYLDTLTRAKPATHDPLQASITKLYASILTYLTKARRYYEKEQQVSSQFSPSSSTAGRETEPKQSGGKRSNPNI